MGIFFIVVLGLLFLVFVYAVAKGVAGDFLTTLGAGVAAIALVVGGSLIWIFGVFIATLPITIPLTVCAGVILLMAKCIF